MKFSSECLPHEIGPQDSLSLWLSSSTVARNSWILVTVDDDTDADADDADDVDILGIEFTR